MLRSNFRLVMTNFDPKIKNEFAEIRRRKSKFSVLILWIKSIILSSHKFDEMLLSYFEHRLYLIFIVGVIDNFIDNSFYCKNISYMSNFKELRNFNYGNSLL